MSDPSLSAVLVNTRATVAAAQEAFAAWALSAVQAAGVPDATVVIGGGGPTTGVVVRLSPLRIGTPGRSLDGGGTPLISPPEGGRDAPRGMPPIWGELARSVQGLVDELMPRLDPRTQRPALPPRIEELAAPLRDWYAAAPSLWRAELEPGVLRARPPTLSWASGTTLRVDYLLNLTAPGPEVIPLMSVLAASLIKESGVDVPSEPLPIDGPLVSFLTALGAAAPGEAAQRLAEQLTQALGPQTQRAALGFASDLSPNEIARVMQQYGATAFPYLTPALQISAGPQLHFTPAAFPNMGSRPRRPGDPA